MRPPIQRFLSLDVFRGMTICFMIIVNTPGSGATPFSPLEHAGWHGFTPTDLVFPSFVFAVGNAMSFSLRRYQEMGNGAFFLKILKRTIVIFLCGYLMYWFPFYNKNIDSTRIFGVLQRIALCYFFAAIFIHYLSQRAIVVVSILLLLGYWIILLLFGDHNQPFSILGNAGLYIDKAILGNNHLYHGEGIPFDPEGILSTLPAIVNALIGYMAGTYIQKSGKNYETISKLMLAGLGLIFIALFWNMVFPINKKLWTSSFVLLTTGIDLLLIAALVYIIEIKNISNAWWTRFFTVFGKNPLAIYLLSELLVTVLFMIHIKGTSFFNWINKIFFQVVAPGAIGSLLFALVYMLFCWSVGWLLNKRKLYIRV
jgi:predicted acyltransferase